MKNLMKISIWSILISMLFVVSCEIEDQIVGQPPTADAGTDINAFVGSSVTLNASNSSDPEGETLSFSWELTQSPSGSSASISNASSAQATFVPDEVGDYTATLTVEDVDGNTATDDVVIIASVNENEAPEAVITDANNQMITPENGNNIINVGNVFQLTAVNSSDPEEDDLTYLWQVSSAPSGSNPTLVNEETIDVEFTADIAGEYTISLIVNDGNGNESTAEATIEAEVAPVIIDADVSEDTNWENIYEDSELADYRVVGSINIEAFLTIDPGVKIILDEDVSIFVSTSGTVVSNGSADNHVQFTSSNVEGGILWKGIEIVSTSSQNSFNYTDFSYAGRSEYGSFSNFVDVETTIAVRSDGRFSLSNSSISNSGGYGIYMRYGEIVSFENNDFSDNELSGIGINLNQAVKIDANSTFSNNQHAVEIYESSFDASSEPTLVALNASNPYYVSGNLDITSLLNIDEGAKFEMAEDVNIKVSDGGVLSAIGTENNKIEFTTANLNAELLWKGFEFTSGDSRNELTHCIISYAGNSVYGNFSNFVDVEATIAMYSDARLSLTNTEISNSGGYGLYSRYGEFVDFSSNSFVDNSYDHLGLPADQVRNVDEATSFTGGEEYAIEVFNGGDLTEESTWVNLNGDAKYNIVEQIIVSAGLTINPGVEIDLNEDVDIDVRDGGYLVANGAADNLITFSSSNEAGQIAWGGIKVYTNDARNSLDFVTINLAGGNETTDLDNFVDEKTAVAGNGNARLNISNSTISNSEGFGVYFQGTINDIESPEANNTFSNNGDGNVY